MGLEESFAKAAEAVKMARALVITAGAGMGVDSGLPDFRGDAGFWNAYPMYRRLGINFVDAANPVHFGRNPAFGWGFYGHRTNLYRDTVPHAGFAILLDWIDRYGLDYFVVTSNVDGQFQKAGFDPGRICEIHGSIHHLQCTEPCSPAIWDNNETIPVDHATMQALHIPKCIRCGGVARPNILMFGDYGWLGERTTAQDRQFDEFLAENRHQRIVVVEMGAGTAIPSIRFLSERIGKREDALVVRINPREAQIGPPHISIPAGALEGLRGMERVLVTP